MNFLGLENLLANSSFLLCFINMISSWVSLIFKLNWTFSISVTSHLVLTLSILCRWISSNHFPLSNLHESLIFLAWIFSLLCVFEYKTFVPLLVTQSVSTKHLGPASLRDSGPPDQLGKHLETVSRPVGSSVSEGNTERSPVPLVDTLVPKEQEGQPLGADKLKLRTGEGQPEGADELSSLREKWPVATRTGAARGRRRAFLP